MIALYMDQHVPASVTEQLCRRGIDVVTVFEDNRAEQGDEEILDRAAQLQRVLFTQDIDFVEITSRRLAQGPSFAGVVYAHQQKATVGQLVTNLELISKVMTLEEMRDQLIRIPL